MRNNTNSVGEYTTSGATVNASLITGLNNPYDIAVVPKPSTALLLSAGIVRLTVRRRLARMRWREIPLRLLNS